MKVYKLIKFNAETNSVDIEFSEESVPTSNVIATFAPNLDGSIPQQAISDFLFKLQQSSIITVVSL